MHKWITLPLLAVSVISAETLTQTERDFAMSQLHASRKLFLDSIAGLTPEQLNFKAGPDRWSIAECSEHIAVSEDFISGMIQDKVLKSPAATTKPPEAEVKAKDEMIVKAVSNRTQKFQAPEPLRPTKRFASMEDLAAHFKESRDRNIAYIEAAQDDLRAHSGPHPVLGPLDAYQWYLLLSGHTERHTAQ